MIRFSAAAAAAAAATLSCTLAWSAAVTCPTPTRQEVPGLAAVQLTKAARAVDICASGSPVHDEYVCAGRDSAVTGGEFPSRYRSAALGKLQRLPERYLKHIHHARMPWPRMLAQKSSQANTSCLMPGRHMLDIMLQVHHYYLKCTPQTRPPCWQCLGRRCPAVTLQTAPPACQHWST